MTSWAAIEDLIWLFESEPQFKYAEVGYPVSATTFTTLRGSAFVECTIEPYMNSLTLRCVEQDEERVLLHLWGVVDTLVVEKSNGRETLVVTLLSDLPFRTLRLDLNRLSGLHGFRCTVGTWTRMRASGTYLPIVRAVRRHVPTR